MKKSLIALVVMGSLSGAAMAQSNVSLYGIVDLGYTHARSGGQNFNGIDSGMQSGSRLGLRGTEDLGQGLKAKFVLESGLNADTGGYAQGGKAFGRQAWLGLEGNFGAVKLGRQYTPMRETLLAVDPFELGTGGSLGRVALDGLTVERVNNAVTYELPSNSYGVNGSAQYAFGEQEGSNSANRTYGMNLGYKWSALTVGLAYNKSNVSDFGAGLDADLTSLALGGVYDFGPAKLHGAYAQQKVKEAALGEHKSRSYMVGVSAPFGPHTVKASYVMNDVRKASESDTSLVAVGYEYALSKRTNFYGNVSYVKNDEFVGLGARGLGDNATVYQVGMRHSF